MPHVLVAGKLHPKGKEMLTSTPGLSIRFIEEISEPSYAPFVQDADALLIRTQPMSAATIARAKRLKIVSRHGVGYDAIDVNALNERGIALAVCGDVNSVAVAEHAMMLMLSACKRTLRANNAVRHGPWEWRNQLESEELQGRNLLLLGYGRIGQALASMATGFGLCIHAHDPLMQQRGWPPGAVKPVENLTTGLNWADIISVNLPKMDQPVIGEPEFAEIKPGAILVNTARGGIVDEVALINALKEGRIAAAGLDVFDTEPMPPNHPLFAFDNVILTPHIAGLTAGAAERMAVGSVKNIIDYLTGQIDPYLVVNRERINGVEA